MKLIFLGEELDSTKEQELVDTGIGFYVTIKYKSNLVYHNECINNCTEVHNLYETFGDRKCIAFESNIHQTGFTREIENVESVIIELSDRIEQEF
ncbi:hypothetical protein M0Q50_02080 [bacterium]|jgi:hypothetical protein|nr:hypothetical protein [bacterium]